MVYEKYVPENSCSQDWELHILNLFLKFQTLLLVIGLIKHKENVKFQGIKK